MSDSSTRSFAPDSTAESFRTELHPSDAGAIERVVRTTGVFSEAEIAIARELVEESLHKGAKASGYYFLIADGPDGIDGYACFGPVPGTVSRWELYWIAVNPLAQRHHLGASLQRAAEKAVAAMGGRWMVAETSTRPDYDMARRFYFAQGYALLAEIPDWHDDGDGLAIFGKRL
jgi:ribosomal protein S18 acetylase RimI-like enzyme